MHVFLNCFNIIFLALVYQKHTLIGTINTLLSIIKDSVDYCSHVMYGMLKPLQLIGKQCFTNTIIPQLIVVQDRVKDC